MQKFFRFLGYECYVEIDVQDRADLLCDLNHPVDEAYHGMFDLIWDNGSIEHIANIYQVFENLLLLVKPGGRIVHTQGIGDQTNAGYWTISPNGYFEFYHSNGCRIDVAALTDRRGHSVPYVYREGKNCTVGAMIPLRFLPGYYLRQMRSDIVARLRWRYSKVRIGLKIPTLLGDALSAKGIRWAQPVGAMLQRWMDWITGSLVTSGPDWGIWIVARCLTKVPRQYPIQGIYRKHLSVALQSRAA